MVKKFLILLLSVCSLFCICGCGEAEEITRGDKVFSEFYATDFDGNTVDNSVFEGHKLTLVNVWATWCEPCKRELPALAELDKEYGAEGFQVIGIAYDTADKNYNKDYGAYKDALDIVKDTGADFRHLVPSKSMKDFLEPLKSVPYTVFVDGNGYRIGGTYVGSKSKKEWKSIIEAYLKFVAESA